MLALGFDFQLLIKHFGDGDTGLINLDENEKEKPKGV